MSITITCPICYKVLDNVENMHQAACRAPMYGHGCRYCPVCEGKDRRLIHTVPGIDQKVYLCDCGMIYSESKPFDYSETSIYAEYEMPEFRDHSAQVARRIDRLFPDRETKIIDIGCATGTLLKALKEIGYRNLEGCDPNAGAIEKLGDINGALASRPENRFTTPQSVMLGMKNGDLTPDEGARMLQKLRRSASAGETRRLNQ